MRDNRVFEKLTVMDLVRAATTGQRTEPTPTFYASTAALLRQVAPFLVAFTWVRFYWALKSTLLLTSAERWPHSAVPES
eukprot:SM000043S15887  [mRNA]  locus=s43:725621:725857:- [translate_table: standard]